MLTSGMRVVRRERGITRVGFGILSVETTNIPGGLALARKLVCVVSRVFFFFQAEDGIRDKLVTGVQTCALPISRFEAGVALAAKRERRGGEVGEQTQFVAFGENHLARPGGLRKNFPRGRAVGRDRKSVV